MERRIETLANPELWLRTYFPSTFFQEFTEDRSGMLAGIVEAARHGGDSAIAGPRGEGKTRIALYAAVYLMFANLSTFPIVIGKSQTKATTDLRSIREQLQRNELLMLDFPEIGVPLKEVGAWSSNQRLQTLAGKFTNIEIAADHLIFPTVTQSMLPEDWPKDVESLASGQIISCMGIDGPIRGTTYRDKRPTQVILDDIEDREAANSDTIIARNEKLIEEDIGGLGGNTRRVSRIMLCTTQNRKCIAYQYTDRDLKPSWRGVRYRKLKTKPDRMDLWERYIDLRHTRSDDDPDARVAFDFYASQRAEMDSGAVISNPAGYDGRQHVDGRQIELSALQSYFNRVADFGQDAVSTEEDNDPPETAGPQGIGLTPGLVVTRLNGLERLQLPAATASLTAAIDLGKWRCHWVVIAWTQAAAGFVVDYGVQQVHGQNHGKLSKAEDISASEPQIYDALQDLRQQLIDADYVDGTGAKRRLDCVLVDSGTYTNAAYAFARNSGKGWHPSKGIGNYRERTKASKTLKPGDHMHAAFLESKKIWLMELDTDYWKNWVHERFAGPTFDTANNIRPGSLSLHELPGRQKHSGFASHICAEELVTEFKEGKGSKTYWQQTDANNHWLDATYMAAAAGRYTGIQLLQTKPAPQPTSEAVPTKKKPRKRHGQQRKSTGWMQRVQKQRRR